MGLTPEQEKELEKIDAIVNKKITELEDIALGNGLDISFLRKEWENTKRNYMILDEDVSYIEGFKNRVNRCSLIDIIKLKHTDSLFYTGVSRS